MNMVEWALEYALAGWRVLPLQGVREGGRCTCSKSHSCTRPGKHPIPSLVKNGVKQATTDKALIKEWFRMAPYANIGIATGPGSDLYVIDFDYTKGGSDTLGELQKRYGFDKTPAVRTGSGGLHLFYAHARGLHNTQGRLGEGVDTRGEGGYVVVPPSRHASGKRYEWLIPPQDMSPSPCPEWVANDPAH